jgi:hypothetical protein
MYRAASYDFGASGGKIGGKGRSEGEHSDSLFHCLGSPWLPVLSSSAAAAQPLVPRSRLLGLLINRFTSTVQQVARQFGMTLCELARGQPAIDHPPLSPLDHLQVRFIMRYP